MRRLVAALVLTFPVCASAQVVRVEYDAVVDSVGRTVCDCDPTRDYARDHPEFTGYSVGDRLHGFLNIDLAKAPADRRPLEPESGIYFAASRSGGFISGNGSPLIHLVYQDSVSVLDKRADAPFDEHYMITDQWRTPNGSGQMAVNLITRAPGFDLVKGDSIAQTIDAWPSGALQMTGYISKVVRNATSSVSVKVGLLFNHVTVMPGRCKA
jgi:hypothetical protein